MEWLEKLFGRTRPIQVALLQLEFREGTSPEVVAVHEPASGQIAVVDQRGTIEGMEPLSEKLSQLALRLVDRNDSLFQYIRRELDGVGTPGVDWGLGRSSETYCEECSEKIPDEEFGRLIPAFKGTRNYIPGSTAPMRCNGCSRWLCCGCMGKAFDENDPLRGHKGVSLRHVCGGVFEYP